MPCLLLIQCEEISRIYGCQFTINAEEKNSVSGCRLPLRIIEKQASKEYQFNSDFYKEPFNLAVLIDGEEINYCDLRNTIKITQAVNSSRIAELAISADCGLLDFYKYASKKIDIIYSSKSDTRTLYSGIVITQKLDKANNVFNLTASDEKLNKIDNLPQTVIDNIGYFCRDLFNDELTKKDEFAKRIESIPADYYFDNNGNLILTPWKPKETADIIFDSVNNKCDILSLTFGVANINEIVNKVDIKFNYNYYRFIQRDITARYAPMYGSLGSFSPEFVRIVKTYGVVPVPRIDTVLNTINGAGWTVGKFYYEHIGDLSSGVLGGIIINDRESYVMYADWTISKRWVQNVQEEYSITIKNAESIAFFNEKKEEISFNLRQPENDELKSDWTDYPCYFAPPRGSVMVNSDWIRPESDIDRQRYAMAMQYALNVAKTKIYYSHFNNELQVEIVFNKDIELQHTIGINNIEFSGNAKVLSIEHNFDLSKKRATTKVKANWFKGFDGGNIRQPERVVLPVVSQPQGVITFGNSWYKKYSRNTAVFGVGGNLEKDYCVEKNGYDNQYGYILEEFIANDIYAAASQGVLSPVKFAIKTPDIEKEMTDGLTATKEIEQDLSIPNTPVYAYRVCE